MFFHPGFLCPHLLRILRTWRQFRDWHRFNAFGPGQHGQKGWDGNMPDSCNVTVFLDTKKCQSTKHIAHSRPYQKVHLALAAFLHWAPLQVHQKVLKQPNLIRIRNHTDQNEVCFCWESIWPKACPKTSPPKESPMVYRRSWWESCMLDVTRRKPKLYLSLLQPPRLLFWRYRRFLQTSMSWLSCFSSKKT